MSISINTKDFMKPRVVNVDGMDWNLKMIGAGSELAMSQAQRRIKLLDTKIANDTATEADFDLYDKLEQQFFIMFQNIFNDGTPDNASVKKWVSDTPTSIIILAFEDIKRQVELNETETINGTTKKTDVDAGTIGADSQTEKPSE